MDVGLKNRRALITGATRGIGAAIARRLAEEGADVAICARDAQAVDNMLRDLNQFGNTYSGRALDITDGSALLNWIHSSASAMSGIDLVVSSASALATSNAESSWRASFETDLISTIRLFDGVRPYLEEAAKSGDASFTAISSISAVETTTVSPYGAIKAALNHYIKGIAHDMAPLGIRANAIAPGQVYFDEGVWGHRKRENPDYYQSVLDANPTKRMGTPEEIAAMVAFIAGSISSFTTGANLQVDGTVTRRIS